MNKGPIRDDQRTSPDLDPDLDRSGGQSDRDQRYVVPPEGSLGLLALGAVGITEWRHARERAKKIAEAMEASKANPEQDERQREENE